VTVDIGRDLSEPFYNENQMPAKEVDGRQEWPVPGNLRDIHNLGLSGRDK